jgi:peptide/nickel transport system substrate-binding protein
MLSHAPPGHPATAGAGLPRYEFDPAKGKALLDAAGWRDLDRDGVREAHGVAGIAEGTRLSVRYQAPASGEHAELVGRIAADLAACGLGVTLSLPSAAEFFAPGESGLLYGRRFDLAGQASLATADLSCARFLSSQVPAKDNGWTGQNVSGYASPAYDAACRAALATLPGTESFVAAQQQVLHILGRDVPILPLLMRYGVVVARPDLAGLRPDPSEPAETWNVEEFRFGP